MPVQKNSRVPDLSLFGTGQDEIDKIQTRSGPKPNFLHNLIKILDPDPKKLQNLAAVQHRKDLMISKNDETKALQIGSGSQMISEFGYGYRIFYKG